MCLGLPVCVIMYYAYFVSMNEAVYAPAPSAGTTGAGAQ
jgi:hypothetical protein